MTPLHFFFPVVLWFHYLFTFMKVHAPKQGHVPKSENSERILEQMSNVDLQHIILNNSHFTELHIIFIVYSIGENNIHW